MIIVVVLGVGYIIMTNYRGQRAADEMLSRLASLGIPPEAPELITDDENAARFYTAADALFSIEPREMNKVPVIGMGDWPAFGEGFSSDQTLFLKKILDRNKPAFEAHQRIGDDDAVRFELDATWDLTHVLRTIGLTRNVARWYDLHCLESTATGEFSQAVRDCIAIFSIPQHMADNDFMIVSLVRISIAAMGQNTVESLLSRSQLTSDQLENLGDVIRDTRNSFDFQNVLRTELRDVLSGLENPHWHVTRLEFIARETARYYEDIISLDDEEALDEQDPLSKNAWEKFQYSMERMFLAWCPGHIQLKVVDQAKQLLAIHDQASNPSAKLQLLNQPRSKKNTDDGNILGITQAYLRANLQLSTMLQVTEAALDIERFRLNEGRWPGTLKEVYAVVPIDPFGHELKLARYKDELRVYSIGENSRDDGGFDQHRDDLPFPDHEADEKDDFRFVLLDPEHRNRPATTPLENPDYKWNQETGEYELDWSDEDWDIDLESFSEEQATD